MTIDKPGAFIMTDSLVDRLRSAESWHAEGKHGLSPDGAPYEAANVLTALEGALEGLKLCVELGDYYGNVKQHIAKADAALSLLRGDGE